MSVVPDDLCLYIIKFAIYLQGFLAATSGTVSLYVPHVKRNALLATELRLCSVNRNSSHNGDNTVLLLAFVGIEENLES